MSPPYICTWEIDPSKKPDLGFDDWHQGFSEATDNIYPKHLGNRAYMMGWLEGLGMQTGYAGFQPIVNEESYLEGWSQGNYERNC